METFSAQITYNPRSNRPSVHTMGTMLRVLLWITDMTHNDTEDISEVTVSRVISQTSLAELREAFRR